MFSIAYNTVVCPLDALMSGGIDFWEQLLRNTVGICKFGCCNNHNDADNLICQLKHNFMQSV